MRAMVIQLCMCFLVAAICSLGQASREVEASVDNLSEVKHSIFDEFPTIVYPTAESSKLFK